MSSYQVSILSLQSSFENVAAKGITLSAAITLARRTAWSIAGQPYLIDVYRQSDEGNMLVRSYDAQRLVRVGLTRVSKMV